MRERNIDIPLEKREYKQICDLILKRTGIFLSPCKTVMVQARLNKRLWALNLKSYAEYIELLTDKSHSSEITNFINQLTTNKTEFFREPEHFDYIKNHYFKELADSTSRTINIWSAACSTGEEVYTLGIVFAEFVRCYPSFDYRILGTDIDTKILSHGEKGVYSDEIAQVIPPDQLRRYFLRGKNRNAGLYRVSDIIRDKVKFRRHNLIEYKNCLPIKFDIIFLRNVLIYFSKGTIEQVISKICLHLKPNGLLFVGHSETYHGISNKLKPVQPSILRISDISVP